MEESVFGVVTYGNNIFGSISEGTGVVIIQTQWSNQCAQMPDWFDQFPAVPTTVECE